MQKETTTLLLRKAIESDLEAFFGNQLDEEAGYMAAFTAKDPTDKEAYMAKWTALINNEAVNIKTILLGAEIAGSVSTYEMEGEPQITYWIGKQYWGKGIATQALQAFLKDMKERPVYGRIAIDNIGSRRVLEKCGFEMIAREHGFANARNMEIEELVFKLST